MIENELSIFMTCHWKHASRCCDLLDRFCTCDSIASCTFHLIDVLFVWLMFYSVTEIYTMQQDPRQPWTFLLVLQTSTHLWCFIGNILCKNAQQLFCIICEESGSYLCHFTPSKSKMDLAEMALKCWQWPLLFVVWCAENKTRWVSPLHQWLKEKIC